MPRPGTPARACAPPPPAGAYPAGGGGSLPVPPRGPSRDVRGYRPRPSVTRGGGWGHRGWLRRPDNYEPGVFRSLDHRAACPDRCASGQLTLADFPLAVAYDRRADQGPGPGGPVAGLDRDGLPGADRRDHAALECQGLCALAGLHRELPIDPTQQEEREDAPADPAAVGRADAGPTGQPAQPGAVRGPAGPASPGAGG